jgi:hypothetical protein
MAGYFTTELPQRSFRLDPSFIIIELDFLFHIFRIKNLLTSPIFHIMVIKNKCSLDYTENLFLKRSGFIIADYSVTTTILIKEPAYLLLSCCIGKTIFAYLKTSLLCIVMMNCTAG